MPNQVWSTVSGTERSVGDFAAWAFADLTTNLKRGMFAEWLVNVALGTDGTPHVDWEEFDIRYRNVGVEVRSAAYLTPPFCACPRTPRFDIAQRTHRYDAKRTKYEPYEQMTRPADIYVFALLTARRKEDYVVPNADAWLFSVIGRDALDDRYGAQKSASVTSLSVLQAFLPFAMVRPRVERLAAGIMEEHALEATSCSD